MIVCCSPATPELLSVFSFCKSCVACAVVNTVAWVVDTDEDVVVDEVEEDDEEEEGWADMVRVGKGGRKEGRRGEKDP